MVVRMLVNRSWHVLANATASQVDANRYLVKITGITTGIRLSSYNSADLLINKRRSFTVRGTHRTSDTLFLEVVVY